MANNYDNDSKRSTIVVCGLWQTRNGHYQAVPLDTRGYDNLASALETGGKFIVRKRTAESIQNSKNPETAPVAYLEFVPKAEVEAFEAQKKIRMTARGGESQGL